MSIYFIVNPFANNGRAQAVFEQCKTTLEDTSINFEFVKTTQRGSATRLAHEFVLTQKADSRLVVVGGDGTVSDVLMGIGQASANLIPLGIIPAGKTNRFNHACGFSADPMVALTRIMQTPTPTAKPLVRYTLGENRNIGYFLNDFSIGLYAQLSDLAKTTAQNNANQTLLQKLTPHWLTNYFSRLNAFMGQEQFTTAVRANGQYRNFKHVYQIHIRAHDLAPHALKLKQLNKGHDGNFCVIITQHINLLARMILRLAQWFNLAHKLPYVHQITCEHLELTIDSLEFGMQDGTSLANQFFHVSFQKIPYPLW